MFSRIREARPRNGRLHKSAGPREDTSSFELVARMKMKCSAVHEYARARVYMQGDNIEGLRNFPLYCRKPHLGG